jgi:hypothetical protein
MASSASRAQSSGHDAAKEVREVVPKRETTEGSRPTGVYLLGVSEENASSAASPQERRLSGAVDQLLGQSTASRIVTTEDLHDRLAVPVGVAPGRRQWIVGLLRVAHCRPRLVLAQGLRLRSMVIGLFDCRWQYRKGCIAGVTEVLLTRA